MSLTDPSAPQEIGALAWEYEQQSGGVSWTSWGSASDVCISGERLLVTGSLPTTGTYATSLRVVDVRDPANPIQLGELVFPETTAGGVAVWGNHAYVAVGRRGIRVVDISQPATPRAVADVHVPPESEWSDDAVTVRTRDGMAYALFRGSWFDRPEDLLAVFDLADPGEPRLAGQVEAVPKPRRLAVDADHAFVVGTDSGLAVVDIDRPSSPTVLGTHHEIGSVYDVEAAAERVYVGAGEHGLRVLDVGAPGAAREIGGLDIPLDHLSFYYGGRRLYVSEEFAIALGRGSRWENEGSVFVILTRDPSQPELGAVVYSDRELGQPAERGIAVSDGHAFVAQLDGFAVIDVRNPAEPVVVKPLQELSHVLALDAAGRRLFVAGWPALRVLEWAGPSDPSEIGRLELEDEDGNTESFVDVHVRDGRAYALGCSGDLTCALRIVDVTFAESPMLMGSTSLAANEYGTVGTVALAADYAYVAAGDLYIIDVSDPWNPRRSEVISTPGFARDVALLDDHLVVADWEGGLLVYRWEAQGPE